MGSSVRQGEIQTIKVYKLTILPAKEAWVATCHCRQCLEAGRSGRLVSGGEQGDCEGGDYGWCTALHNNVNKWKGESTHLYVAQ